MKVHTKFFCQKYLETTNLKTKIHEANGLGNGICKGHETAFWGFRERWNVK